MGIGIRIRIRIRIRMALWTLSLLVYSLDLSVDFPLGTKAERRELEWELEMGMPANVILRLREIATVIFTLTSLQL